MLPIAIPFILFQLGFTFWFPFIAAGLYWEQQTPLLKGLFGLAVALLVLMVPMIPRLALYTRFWLHLSPLVEFATTCDLFLHHPGAKDGTGKALPLVDAAIQDFYTPSRERAVVWALRTGGATRTSFPSPSLGPDCGSPPVLLPFDVVHRLSTFSSSSHIQMSELTRREALEINGESELGVDVLKGEEDTVYIGETEEVVDGKERDERTPMLQGGAYETDAFQPPLYIR
jgi:hypothetical protein